MAKFEKGNKASKGRPKGAKNKNPLQRKQELERLFNEHGGFEQLFNTIRAIEEPKDQANILLKTMEFFMSKEKAIELTTDLKNETVNVTFTHTLVPKITSETQLFDDD